MGHFFHYIDGIVTIGPDGTGKRGFLRWLNKPYRSQIWERNPIKIRGLITSVTFLWSSCCDIPSEMTGKLFHFHFYCWRMGTVVVTGLLEFLGQWVPLWSAFFFFKILLIYSWETQRRQTQAEGEAGSLRGPHVAPHPRSRDHVLPWAKGRCSTTELHRHPWRAPFLLIYGNP